MDKSTPGSCAKFIVAGEYSVLQDSPCIVFPIHSRRLKLLSRLTEDCPEGFLALRSEEIQQAAELLQAMGENPRSAKSRAKTLVVRSNIPRSSGLGSSAAFCVELARMALATEDPQILFEKSWAAESLIHGNSSGADPACVSFGKRIVYQKSKGARQLKLGAAFNDRLWILRNSMGLRSSTMAARDSIRRVSSDKNKSALLEQLSHHSTQLVSALESDELGTFKSHFASCGKLLGELGVETEDTLKAQESLRALGCAGTKITGAGLGGYVLGYTNRASLSENKIALQKDDLIVSFQGHDETAAWVKSD